MNKIKLFLDFDATIVDSSKAFCKAYDSIHGTTTDYTKVEDYNFSPVLKLSREEIDNIFSSEVFFNNLEFFKGLENVLNKFKEWYDYINCTIGTAKNLYMKNLWLKEKNTINFKEFIGINNFNKDRVSGPRMDKSSIQMDNGVFIDDHKGNIKSSNASIKILYQGNPINKWSIPDSDTGEHFIVTNWTDGKIEKILYDRIYGR